MRKAEALTRFLIAFVLALAFWPARAVAAPCAPAEKPTCPMACCAKVAVVSAELKAPDCGCAVLPAPKAVPPSRNVAASPTAEIVATPTPAPTVCANPIVAPQPGTVGGGSGPPPDRPPESSLGRAPPVA